MENCVSNTRTIKIAGENGAERGVREDLADGNVQYFEGERGAERCVRVVQGASEDKAAAEKRYKAMRVAELRSECERLGLATTGVKAALVARLLAACAGITMHLLNSRAHIRS